MRKLTPYDEIICICKSPLKVTEKGGASGAGDCQCLAYAPPGIHGVRSLKQFQALQRAQKMKLTKFKVRGAIITPVKVVAEGDLMK
jgi:hypothetical protein